MCEENFVDMNTMRNHKVLQHEVTNSPIPKIEGTDDDDNVDDKVYDLKIEAHDIIEAKLLLTEYKMIEK